MARICDRCGTKVGFVTTVLLYDWSSPHAYICQKCTPIVAKEESEGQRLKQLKQAADKIIVTTTN